MARASNSYMIFVAMVFLLAGACPVYGQQDRSVELQWYNFDETNQLLVDHEKDMLLFMEADWCGVCKRMHREVFTDSTIQSIITTYFYPVRVDIESKAKLTYNGQTMTSKAFSKKMKMSATPTTIFLQPDHSVIGRKAGFTDVSELSILLEYIHSDAWERMTFEAYQNQTPDY
ncbi:thioredoxin family protein [Gracilimonas sp.]|uniref:thioredoxin family protein n=1 Tax=Gracilimonas sp. TaxID=1974203 RepID=UPI003BA9B7AA